MPDSVSSDLGTGETRFSLNIDAYTIFVLFFCPGFCPLVCVLKRKLPLPAIQKTVIQMEIHISQEELLLILPVHTHGSWLNLRYRNYID